MLRRIYVWVAIVAIIVLAACVSTPTATPTPAPTLTPSPTSTPTPTPTPTPIPPLMFSIRRPASISALEAVPVEVELKPPPGVDVDPSVSATVLDPDDIPYWMAKLAPQAGGTVYSAETPLQLPLEPVEGDWRLRVDVQSSLSVRGKRELTFRPDPIPFRELSGLPQTFQMDVPQAFSEVATRGDSVAGGRVWHYGEGALELWWAPGPVEPLLLNNAIVMLETTYEANAQPHVFDVKETVQQDRPAFIFQEAWAGTSGGPAKALVAQGPDYVLYVVRVRALGSQKIPSLLYQVWETFEFVE